MTASRLGPLLLASKIEEAVRDHLLTPDPTSGQTWIDTGLGIVERELGLTEPLERPRGIVTTSQFAKWPEDQIPVVLVIVPGLTGRPVMRGNRIYEARWGLGVAAVVSDVDADASAEMATAYGAALRWAMLAKPSLGGITQGLSWIDEKYDEIGRNRNLATARVVFEAIIEQSVQVAAVPSPPADSSDDPGPWPTVSEITTDVQPRTLTEAL